MFYYIAFYVYFLILQLSPDFFKVWFSGISKKFRVFRLKKIRIKNALTVLRAGRAQSEDSLVLSIGQPKYITLRIPLMVKDRDREQPGKARRF